MTVIDLPLHRFTGRVNISPAGQTGRSVHVIVRVDRTDILNADDVSEWLQENVLGGGEAEIVRSGKVVRFHFQDDADAALFKMRWC